MLLGVAETLVRIVAAGGSALAVAWLAQRFFRANFAVRPRIAAFVAAACGVVSPSCLCTDAADVLLGSLLFASMLGAVLALAIVGVALCIARYRLRH